MLFFADDEQDKDLDNEEDGEDADADKDSEDEGDDSDDEDAGDDSDDSEEDDESDEEEDEDDKPVTRKELREMLKGNKNNRNASRRVSQKDKGRDTKQPTDTDKRVEALEKSQKETMLLERKRTFGYENGLSPKQVNHVFRLTKRPTAKFLAKPHVKAALDAIKSQENVGRNTPSGSGKRNRSQGDKKWTDLKPEERQNSLADRRREILERNRK